MAVLAKNSIRLTMPCSNTSNCSSFAGYNVELQYEQIIELSAEAISYPNNLTLVLLNPAREKL